MSISSTGNFGETVTQARKRVNEITNPENHMFGYRKPFMFWAVLNVLITFIFMSPNIVKLAGFYAWTFEYIFCGICLAQLLCGALFFRIPIRFSIGSFLVMVFFVYTMVSSFIVNQSIGRTIVLAVGWQTYCFVCYLFLTVSIEQAVYCGKEVKLWIKRVTVAFYALSGIVGVLQWVNLFRMREIFDNHVLHEVYRPNGMTDYPSQLAFQAVIALLLIGSPLVKRELRLLEWLGIIFFSFVILMAQYRSLYYGGLLPVLLTLGVLQFRQNKTRAMVLLVTSLLFVAALFACFPEKLAYGLRPAENDAALAARKLAWTQVGDIIAVKPMTGIGPDPTLILGPSFARTDHWATYTIDNLYYLMTACYGYIGLTLFVVTFLVIFIGLLIRMSTYTATVEWGIMAAVALVCVATYGISTNAVYYQPVGFSLAILLGISSPTWKDSNETYRLPQVLVAIRKLLIGSVRKIGIRS
jgi:hypothetical protein